MLRDGRDANLGTRSTSNEGFCSQLSDVFNPYEFSVVRKNSEWRAVKLALESLEERFRSWDQT